MPLAARVAHARLLLEAAKFSGEISGQKMVDSGRSEGEDSDGGGLDGRWWLKRENRRFEASVAGDDRGQMRRRKRWKRPVFCFVGGWRPFCSGLEAWDGRRWEIGRERESRRREEREALGYTTVWTLARYTGAAEACDPLDLWWKDRATVIGLICRLIGWSGWAAFWSGMTRCTERLVHWVTWHHWI